jgi:hypothetical protein
MINQKSKTYIIWDIHKTDKHKRKKRQTQQNHVIPLLHHSHPWLADGRKNIRRRIASLKD